MGVIFRQTLKSSIYSYSGVIIGFISVGFLMPKFLSTEEIGVIRQIQYYSMLLASFASIGLPQSIVRLFPHFVNKTNKNHGFITLISIITTFSAVIFTLFFLWFSKDLLKNDILKSPLFSQYYKLIIPFTLATLIFMIIDSYSNVQKESTIGIFLKDFLLRLTIFILLTIYAFTHILNYHNFISWYIILQFTPIIGALLFLRKKGLLYTSLKFSFPSPNIRKEFIQTSSYNWINILSSVAVVTIDSIMLSKYTNSSTVGIYTTITFFAGLILIPNKSMGKISNVIIANYFKNNEFKNIESIYKKSALNPLIAGAFLLGNLILTIPIIFEFILTPEYYIGSISLVVLAFSNFLKMGTGLKYNVILNSPYYKWNTFLFIGFMALLIFTNMIFIPLYGISGAEWASFISTLLFHLAGIVLIYKKYLIHPFNMQWLKVLLLFSIIFIICYFIPPFGQIWIDTCIKVSVFSLGFSFFTFKLKLSTDINHQLDQFISKF